MAIGTQDFFSNYTGFDPNLQPTGDSADVGGFDLNTIGPGPTQSTAGASNSSGAGLGGLAGALGGGAGITAGIGLAGIGTSLYGAISGFNTAKDISNLSGENAESEIAINSWRQQQVQLTAQRQQMENFRNVQRTRAMGMASAVQSGAQFGSGIAGAQSSESAQGAQNTRNTNQNLGIANNIFGLTNQIDQNQVAISGLQGQLATDQGIMAVGSALTGSAGTFGKIFS